ncbi:MAG: MG2 domain-containing protein, partial [Planctomycetota bacterium]|nr:MG2 domain-containing protein [Planctomycetota bacterium]
MRHIRFIVLALGLLVALPLPAGEAPVPDQRAVAEKAKKDGNWKVAYETFRKVLLDEQSDPAKVGGDLTSAIECLNRLNRIDEVDDLREKALAVHAKNWRFLATAAQSLINDQHMGFIVAGKFSRGYNRGGGQYVVCLERDRRRALQLLTQALDLVKQEPDKNAAGSFYLQFASAFLTAGNREAWRLQYLSDLKELPDYDDYSRGNRYFGGGDGKGAPVGPDGLPVFYKTPKTYETAASDGERWRWCLLQAMEVAPTLAPTARMEFATFLRQQFDVCSLAAYGRYFRSSGDDEGKEQENIYSFRTLSEEETIAKLATGVKRFKLPDEFNFIKVLQQLANEKTNRTEQALNLLAQLFADRQQYPKAAEYWKRSIQECGDQKDWKQGQLNQIIGNWGQFENVSLQPAGTPATIEYRFRNGSKVSFVATEVDVPKLLADVKAYVRAKPKQLDWQKMDLSNIGFRLVTRNENQYLGKQAGAWEMDLKPRAAHLDRRATIATPLEKPGAYLLTATMAGGNTSRIVIWLADTAIARKQMDNGAYYFVADAVTGKPLADANVEFFGYTQDWRTNPQKIDTKEFAERSDPDGQVKLGADKISNNFQWLVTAGTPEGRFAYLGFNQVWYGRYHDEDYNATKVFVITDRPAYRPDQPMKFKCWLAQTKYDAEGKSPFAGQSTMVRIHNPKGDKIFEKQFTADEYGGFDGEYALPKDATLGAYYIDIVNRGGGGSFRVEEYKKPEFEVKVDAPTEPVMLGEKVTATITAKYYFGAPVTDAKVKYKVLRSDYTATWYPMGRWDWFYAPGYWWFACDYAWYPGWEMWGCRRPSPWWWGSRQAPPELVMENEVPVGADGTVKVELDTALAKALHADTDHKYELTVEVTDQSRRTITGSGNVMVARRPFKVYTWVDRGHYRVGEVVQASLSAQTLDNKPVKGKGQLKLLKITYEKDGKPIEKPAQEWALDTDDQGKAQMQVKAAEPGQYRLSYTLTDTKNHSIEGGYVFCIIGEGFDGAGFRFNNIELVTDKREYKPGESVQLMINTNRVGGTVVLFTRPANNIYLPPKIIRMKGKSVLEPLEIIKKDMPNFFIEAFTISDGKCYSETREIIVPPESRVLDVTVTPSKKVYKPGEKGKVQLKLV